MQKNTNVKREIYSTSVQKLCVFVIGKTPNLMYRLNMQVTAYG